MKTDGKALELFRLLDEFATLKGLPLEDGQSLDSFIEEVKQTLFLRKNEPTVVHGLRIQSMFAYVAVALGNCALIKEEDTGLFFSAEESLQRPDFKITTNLNEKFFVEVKNFSPKKFTDPFKVKASYLIKLKNYASKFSQDLKFAIYWHRMSIWTLVGAEFFDKEEDVYVLSFEAALKRNEMSILGDCMIGVVPPLSLRFYTDPKKSRTVESDGLFSCTIERVALVIEEKEITDPVEQSLAKFFMFYGNWGCIERPANIQMDTVLWLEIQANRSIEEESEEPEQEFFNIGWLSHMISRQYNELTTKDGKVHNLTPQKQPHDLGVIIPKDYKGEVLRIWRFYLRPNYNDFNGAVPQKGIQIP